jgi:hypothetical protein
VSELKKKRDDAQKVVNDLTKPAADAKGALEAAEAEVVKRKSEKEKADVALQEATSNLADADKVLGAAQADFDKDKDQSDAREKERLAKEERANDDHAQALFELKKAEAERDLARLVADNRAKQAKLAAPPA